MWSERDRKYGGRKLRYRDSPQAALRCLDPIRKRPVSFTTELAYENWLLYWADPKITNLVVQGDVLSCIERGRVRSVSPDLRFTLDGNEIQLVVPREETASEDRMETLRRVADTHGFRWAIQTREKIRKNIVLLQNLDRLRQAMTMHVDARDLHVERAIRVAATQIQRLLVAMLGTLLGGVSKTP